MTGKDIFQDATAKNIGQGESTTLLEALLKEQNIPLSLGAIATIFENKLAQIFGNPITGQDHEGQRVPLYFGRGPHAHQFFIGTSPESDPKTPQNRVEYTLELASDGNLTARCIHIQGSRIIRQTELGQAKFNTMREEIDDLLAGVLIDIRNTFSPRYANESDAAPPAGAAAPPTCDPS